MYWNFVHSSFLYLRNKGNFAAGAWCSGNAQMGEVGNKSRRRIREKCDSRDFVPNMLILPVTAPFPCLLLKLRKRLASRTYPPTPKSVNRGLKRGRNFLPLVRNTSRCATVPGKVVCRFSGLWTEWDANNRIWLIEQSSPALAAGARNLKCFPRKFLLLQEDREGSREFWHILGSRRVMEAKLLIGLLPKHVWPESAPWS